jgi:hypothetical protein
MVQRLAGRALSVAVLALGMVAASTGVVGASSATTVTSDKAVFSGTQTPGPSGFTLKSTKCSLRSDHERTPFPCRFSAIFSNAGTATGTISSADGTTTFKAVWSPNPPTIDVGGSCTEADAPDPGQPKPKPYPCSFSGTITPGSANTFTGTATVSESSTAP